MDWKVSLVGLVVGGVMGCTGIGAGTLTMPLLVLWLRVPPLEAVGSNVVYAALTLMVGGWQHASLETVDYRIVSRLSIGSVPASVLAAWWIAGAGAGQVGHQTVVTQVIGATLIAAALVLAGQTLVGRNAGLSTARANGWLLGPGGVLLGGAVGATSVGSGSFGTGVLSITTRLQGPRMVGTVTAHAAVLTLAGALTHLTVGAVRLELVAALLLGSVPGVVLGSRLATRMPEPALRSTLALLLLVVGVRMQFPATPPGEGAAALPGGLTAPADPDRVSARIPAGSADVPCGTANWSRSDERRLEARSIEDPTTKGESCHT